MFTTLGKPGTGKTKSLINAIYHETNGKGILVCENPTRMIEKLYTWGFPDLRCISYSDYLKLENSNEIYYIDCLEKLLEEFAKPRGKIQGWSYTLLNSTD